MWTRRVEGWFVAGDGWRSHAIEAGMFVDLEQDLGQDFERAGEEVEVEGRDQEWYSAWTSRDAGSDAGMVIGLSCRTKIRLVEVVVVVVVVVAVETHIHLGAKQASLLRETD